MDASLKSHIMKKRLLPLFMAGAVLSASAVDTEKSSDLLHLDAEARVDYEYFRTDGRTNTAESGFKGKYLALRADGTIIPGLTYSWRQRLNKMHRDQSFFDATDWIYLNYAVDRWNFQVGKEVVAMGGWEYNRAPVDIMCGSIFWHNIPCYDLGVSVSYDPAPADRITFQVVQSPFFTTENRNMFGYNLMWDGRHGLFHALWSANMIEYHPGRYISYIVLGNKFTFDKVEIELDLMNRAASRQTYFFKDCSVMGEVAWRPTERWRVYGKASYDINHTDTDADLTVFSGTEITVAGGGVEFFPLLKQGHSLRLHAGCFYAWGTNTNPADVLQDKTLMITTGITWKMNFFNLKKH